MRTIWRHVALRRVYCPARATTTGGLSDQDDLGMRLLLSDITFALEHSMTGLSLADARAVLQGGGTAEQRAVVRDRVARIARHYPDAYDVDALLCHPYLRAWIETKV